MDKFEFDGRWWLEIQLIEFAKFNHPDLKRNDGDADKGIFNMTIKEVQDFNPVPEEAQLNAINYLLNPENQKEIIEAIFTYTRDVVYPEIQKGYREDETWPGLYPLLNTSDDLYHLIAINDIIIHPLQKDDFAYYVLGFNWSLDPEHGLYFNLHKSRVVEFGQMDIALDGVLKEQGIDPTAFYEKRHEERVNQSLTTYEPHPEYGLKPWQYSANQNYPYGLLHEGKNEKLKVFLQENQQQNLVDSLLNVAVGQAYEEAIEMLIEFKPQEIFSTLITATNENRNDLVKKLIPFEKRDLNELAKPDPILYYAFLNLAQRYADPIERDKALEIIDLLMGAGINPVLKDHWERDTFSLMHRIEPENLLQELRAILGRKITEHGFN